MRTPMDRTHTGKNERWRRNGPWFGAASRGRAEWWMAALSRSVLCTGPLRDPLRLATGFALAPSVGSSASGRQRQPDRAHSPIRRTVVKCRHVDQDEWPPSWSPTARHPSCLVTDASTISCFSSVVRLARRAFLSAVAAAAAASVAAVSAIQNRFGVENNNSTTEIAIGLCHLPPPCPSIVRTKLQRREHH